MSCYQGGKVSQPDCPMQSSTLGKRSKQCFRLNNAMAAFSDLDWLCVAARTCWVQQTGRAWPPKSVWHWLQAQLKPAGGVALTCQLTMVQQMFTEYSWRTASAMPLPCPSMSPFARGCTLGGVWYSCAGSVPSVDCCMPGGICSQEIVVNLCFSDLPGWHKRNRVGQNLLPWVAPVCTLFLNHL